MTMRDNTQSTETDETGHRDTRVVRTGIISFVAVMLLISGVAPFYSTGTASAEQTTANEPFSVYLSDSGLYVHVKYESGKVVNTSVAAYDLGEVEDFDGDGNLEIPFRDPNNNLKYMDLDGTDITDTGVQVSATVFGIEDFDGDADLDIIYSPSTGDLAYVDAAGNNVTLTSSQFSHSAGGGVADTDGDGLPEAAIATGNSNLALMDSNNQTRVESAPTVYDTGQIADIDGDGALEVPYVTDFSGGYLKYFHLDTEVITNTSIEAKHLYGTGDYDGDGDIDVSYVTPGNTLHHADYGGNTVNLSEPAREAGDIVGAPVKSTTTSNLSIESREYLRPNQSVPYEVFLNTTNTTTNTSTRVDVTANATVLSNDTSLLTVNQTSNTFIATNNSSIAGRVNVTAYYTTDDGTNVSVTKEIAVASLTADNLEIIPTATWRFAALFGGGGVEEPNEWIGNGFMFILVIATLGAVAAARFASSFAGLSMGTLIVTMGWFGGYVGYGMAAVCVFISLFIGLNVAANINYTAGTGFGRQ